jgi:23S rRNA (adenine2503-C2)-methyltransferase
VLTKLRDSAGQDVDAGCGQLRARTLGGGAVVTLRRGAAGAPAAHLEGTTG